MTTLTETLRTLHRIHQQLADLQDRLARGPRQIKVTEANVKKCEADIATAKELYKTARISSDERQLQLKQREARIKDLQTKLHGANNNKEYQLLKDQIAADQQANSVLSDEILEGLERLDALQENVKGAEVVLSKTKDELAKVKARVDEQQERLESELVRVQSELAEAEKPLPEEMRAEYNRLVKGRGADAFGPLDGGTCGGCFTMLSPQTIDQLRLNKLVYCKSCGRLMYAPEE
ncbi:protein of unknown function DUF164 [Pirellula staleyi DSM 6068]|uniref:C4-type zinc ribbon domain-containing protein n=1 Tax=Pirellula staleyi (strain ATCC 27377 / DSM 6068 / ICPB 4128) TaxID=530564 RepID=D2R6Q9_PIRSD|nr:C4-type zinc ribbon domain-containing protein [Pirellula staleyi]ADB17359.1 protein of unknown function DUF164 [Pirellula staleyi DSM 6068]